VRVEGRSRDAALAAAEARRAAARADQQEVGEDARPKREARAPRPLEVHWNHDASGALESQRLRVAQVCTVFEFAFFFCERSFCPLRFGAEKIKKAKKQL